MTFTREQIGATWAEFGDFGHNMEFANRAKSLFNGFGVQ